MTSESTFDISTFNVEEFDRILACGLSKGLGQRGNQVCIEAAICQTLGLPHSDDPGCVADAVRTFKIALNDSKWSSPKVRAEGLRDLGLAQLGSKGVVGNVEFTTRLSKKVIQVLIPALFREVFPDNDECLAVALRCEQEGTEVAADSAYSAAYSAADSARSADSAYSAYSADPAYSAARLAEDSACFAAGSAYSAADSARLADSADSAARSAYSATRSAHDPDKYLKLAASLALDVLKELKSPGVTLLK